MAVPPAPVLVPSQRLHKPSATSVTSVANDKDDNEVILGTVHRSLGICLTAEENDWVNANYLSYFVISFLNLQLIAVPITIIIDNT